MSRGGDPACKVYVGDLPPGAAEKELEREFNYYGKLRSVWVARNPPGFAFVEFEDPRDAEDAINGLDGKYICGGRVRVEPSSRERRPKSFDRGGPRGRGPPRYDSRGGGGRGNQGKPFDPNDECYKCGKKGHYAYDCREGGSGGRGGGRPRSPDRYRGRSRSRSRSRGRRSRSYSGGRGREYSRSVSPRQ